jgi:hypothetical protein
MINMIAICFEVIVIGPDLYKRKLDRDLSACNDCRIKKRLGIFLGGNVSLLL